MSTKGTVTNTCAINWVLGVQKFPGEEFLSCRTFNKIFSNRLTISKDS